ncbi:hypothetical protein LSTR_LSTR016000, partial [Laodelphax striatellus]
TTLTGDLEGSIVTSIEERSISDIKISIDGEDELMRSSKIIENFKLKPNLLDEKVIPDLTNMQPWPATEAVANLLEIDDDETNFKSFWVVDTLASGLKQLQNRGVQQSNQKAFVYWFFHILETIQVHNWSREETFSTVKLLFVRAEKIILSESEDIPAPQACSEINPRRSSAASEMRDDKMDEKDERFEILKERNQIELGYLIDLIYNIFANRFKYEVIRTTYANISTWESIEDSDAINLPRTLRLEAIEKPARKEKGERRPLKGSAVISTKDDMSEEQILPLLKAVDQKFFDELFPIVKPAKKNKAKKEKPKKKKK